MTNRSQNSVILRSRYNARAEKSVELNDSCRCGKTRNASCRRTERHSVATARRSRLQQTSADFRRLQQLTWIYHTMHECIRRVDDVLCGVFGGISLSVYIDVWLRLPLFFWHKCDTEKSRKPNQIVFLATRSRTPIAIAASLHFDGGSKLMERDERGDE